MTFNSSLGHKMFHLSPSILATGHGRREGESSVISTAEPFLKKTLKKAMSDQASDLSGQTLCHIVAKKPDAIRRFTSGGGAGL